MAVTLKGQTAVYEGTSTDTKPTDADNNAIFKELDTGIRYYYDGTDWNEIPSSGGGGGGTGTDNYNELNNKPSINGTVLSGNKSLDNLGIQEKLTFDSAPTEDSENPVESGGVYSALAGKQDTISDLSAIRSGADAGATAVQPTELETALAQKQDALSSEQLDAVNSGITSADVEQITTNKNNILSVADQSTQYNIVPIKSTISTGNASVTVTVAADKTITIEITGTTSTAVGFEISDNFAVDTSAQYVMTGCPSSGAVRLILQQAKSPYNWIGQQYNNQAAAVSPNVSLVRYYVYIYANSSGTITIKPMLTPKTLWDKGFTDYQPYALPNTTITPALKECVNNGVKNLVAISDSTITGSNYVFDNVPCNIPAGSYVFSYTSNQSIQGDVEFVIKNSGGTTITSKTVTSSSGRVSIPFTISETGSKLTLYSVRAGTYSNFMICEKSLDDVSSTYEPYALSNAELTAQSQKVISTSGNTSKLRLTLDTTVMSNANRGSLLLSIPFQTSSYDNALLLIAIGNDSFLGVQRLDNSNNSMVTSWTLSENNTILDITLRAQPWSAPVAFPMAQVVPPITYSWES